MLQGRESSPKSYQQIVSSGQHDKLAIGADLREEKVHWILKRGKVNLIFDKMKEVLKRTYGMYKFRLKRTYRMYKFRLKRTYPSL